VPRIAIADFEFARQRVDAPPAAPGHHDGPTDAASAGEATQFNVYDPQFLRDSTAPAVGGFSNGSSNARDAQLAEATRQAVDAAAAGLVGAASRLSAGVPGLE
jgi:hypothetical protein